MYKRQVTRLAQSLQTNARQYATGSASSGSNSARTSALAIGSVTLIGGAYWYFSKDAVPVPAPTPAFTGQGFIDLKLDSIENINHNTKKFRFALPEKNQVSGLATASCILTKFKGPDMEKAVIRPYTPTSDEDERGHIDLIVKKYPTGVMSSHFHEMTPGQTLEFKGPISKYPWTPNMHKHIALIAGGTGIAPMYQLVRAIFKNPEDKTKVTLVFGNVTEEDILLRKELNELENTYPQRFKAIHVLNEAPKSWEGEKGFITKEILEKALPHPKEEQIKVFVCGPPPMYKAISGAKKSASDQGELDGSILEKLGYTKEQVFKF
ncbi:NADH-cytochrome b5 reductase 2 [Podosphaera aphanis]|nr:NADH-cytochrome b5 reductase 2 [Podosphaera aphanis]